MHISHTCMRQVFDYTEDQKQFAGGLTTAGNESGQLDWSKGDDKQHVDIMDACKKCIATTHKDYCILGVALNDLAYDALANDINKLDSVEDMVTVAEAKFVFWGCFVRLRNSFLQDIIVCTKSNITGWHWRMCMYI